MADTPTNAAAARGPLAQAWGGNLTAASLTESLADSALRLASLVPRESAESAALVAPLLQAARDELGTPWPQPKASSFARYFRDGIRAAYEDEVRARQHRLTRAVIACVFSATDNDHAKWLAEVVDGVTLLAEQSTWCWVAHDDVHDRSGAVVPDPGAPFLDLGAGEVAGQLAWIDVALAEQLDEHYPGIRSRMQHEVTERVLAPFLARRDWHWLGLDGDVDNWNPWIHGNVLIAATVFERDAERRGTMVALAVEGIDRYLGALPDDGAIDEGYAYWWNGAARALDALEVLSIATGDPTLADPIPQARATVGFPAAMHIGGPWYANFADAPARMLGTAPWRTLYTWGAACGDDAAVEHAIARARETSMIAPDAGLGRTLMALGDHTWLTAQAAATPARSTHSWHASVGVLMARTGREAPVSVVVAEKAGHNGEHHNHKDVGSFVYAAGGAPVVVDAGQPTYVRGMFGPQRYDHRAMQSGWHNVPAPWGLEQRTGPSAQADVKLAASEEDPVARLALELRRAYGLSPENTVRRDFEFDRLTGILEIHDSWRLTPIPNPAYEGMQIRLLVCGSVEQVEPGVLRVGPQFGGDHVEALRIDISGATHQWELETWEMDDPLLRGVWGPDLTRITIEIPHASRRDCEGSVTTRLTPVARGSASARRSTSPAA